MEIANMSNEIKIRNAQTEDAAVLAAAEREIAKVPGRLASRPHELKDDDFRKKIVDLNKSDTGIYVVVESNGKIIGHAFLDPLKLEVTAHAVDLFTIFLYIVSLKRMFRVWFKRKKLLNLKIRLYLF
jgi:hypothetical protein